jgi:hypothetical protein
MKRRLLAIVLSLALLTSLFVFASPVIAKTDNNDKFFDVVLDYTRVPSSGGWLEATRVWHGSPATLTLPLLAADGPLETRTLENGTVMQWRPIWGEGWIEADFGPVGTLYGYCNLYWVSSQNYNTGKGTSNATAICEFYESFDPALWIEQPLGEPPEEWGDVIATAKFKIQGKSQMIYWNYDVDPGHRRYQSTTELASAKITLISSSGLLEGLKVVGEVDELLTHSYWEGIGHFAP